MWLIETVVWAVLVLMILHIVQEWWRDFKKGRAERRAWEVQRRRASFYVVK
jgi:uncharacterized membrane protein